MQTILCYNRCVTRNFEKKEASLAMKIAPSIKRQVEQIAEKEDRTVSYVASELMVRGLMLYELDGRLKGSPPGVLASEITVGPAKKKKAPVVARIEPGPKTVTKADVRRMLDDDDVGEIERRLERKRKAR